MRDTIEIAAELVAAFVSNNTTRAADLPDLLKAVHAALSGAARVVAEEAAPKLTPAVPIRKSVHHDFIFSLETGEIFRTLRRHLSGLNLTPDEYREKWGLPKDYPMVARGYSERRSALAKSLGLGRKPTEPVVDEAPVKVRKPRSKPTAAAQAPTTPPESVQKPAESSPASIEARSTAPVEAEAPARPLESLAQPSEAQHEAA